MLGLRFQLSPSCIANTHAVHHTTCILTTGVAPELPERKPACFAQCFHKMHQRKGQERVEGDANDRTNKIHVRKNDGKEIK